MGPKWLIYVPFFFNLSQGAGIQERARVLIRKQHTQVERKPTHIRRNPTSVEKQFVQSERDDVPELQTVKYELILRTYIC